MVTAPTDLTESEHRAAASASLDALFAGNQRFISGETLDHRVSEVQRAELAAGQNPMAAVFGCVDSRVPPEVLFDLGLGEVLTIRTAGQALGGAALGSIEFGVRALGLELLVVSGHNGCGAVAAALAPDPLGGPLGDLRAELVERLEASGAPTEPDQASIANVLGTIAELRAMDWLLTPSGHAPVVVGLVHDLATESIAIVDDGGLDLRA